MDLFVVRSQVEKFRECKIVPFRWFCERQPNNCNYADLIEGYDPSDEYAKGFIDELFNLKESRQLQEFLSREVVFDEPARIVETIIEQIRLPIAHNSMGVGALSVGGSDGFYMLHKLPDYSLPFKVCGYFDLEGCELIDGSDVYRHRLYYFDNCGELRMETNKEAAAREKRTSPSHH